MPSPRCPKLQSCPAAVHLALAVLQVGEIDTEAKHNLNWFSCRWPAVTADTPTPARTFFAGRADTARIVLMRVMLLHPILVKKMDKGDELKAAVTMLKSRYRFPTLPAHIILYFDPSGSSDMLD
jgi:hypothetical protein